MTTYIVDNSIWQKAARSATIAERLRRLPPQHLVMTCPPQVLEYCHSARSAAEYRLLRQYMDGLLPAQYQPDESAVLDVQQALWEKGTIRSAAAFDCLIAAYAIANDAIVLHSDRDFEYIADAVGPAFRQEYVPE
ncbi:PIN domain-containing protein [Herbiconiux sp. UC225_62]|uniref:PIN domain-containing protein n=1 Tax=Herbiconiux sp. UC225_62 TaxID=3350168 RepID=UPI0036D3D710